MKIPVDKLTRAFKMGASVKKDSDTPVRVSVYLDSSASRFLAETVRDAFVPQTTSGIVRVERLGEERIAPKTDTDVVLVLSCGSDRLESAVQELVIAGAPVCVLAGGLVIRAVTRALVKQTPHIGFAVKALTAAAGTYGMGRALVSLYERDVDYSRANEVVTATFSRVRDLVTTVAGATRPMASYQDASDLAA